MDAQLLQPHTVGIKRPEELKTVKDIIPNFNRADASKPSNPLPRITPLTIISMMRHRLVKRLFNMIRISHIEVESNSWELARSQRARLVL